MRSAPCTIGNILGTSREYLTTTRCLTLMSKMLSGSIAVRSNSAMCFKTARVLSSAVVRWPAFRKWSDPNYLLSKIGDVEIWASCSPKIEAFGLRTESQDMVAIKTTRDHMLPPRPVRQLLPRLRMLEYGITVPVTWKQSIYRLVTACYPALPPRSVAHSETSCCCGVPRLYLWDRGA